jgi:hypothetical protein
VTASQASSMPQEQDQNSDVEHDRNCEQRGCLHCIDRDVALFDTLRRDIARLVTIDVRVLALTRADALRTMPTLYLNRDAIDLRELTRLAHHDDKRVRVAAVRLKGSYTAYFEGRGVAALARFTEKPSTVRSLYCLARALMGRVGNRLDSIRDLDATRDDLDWQIDLMEVPPPTGDSLAWATEQVTMLRAKIAERRRSLAPRVLDDEGCHE